MSTGQALEGIRIIDFGWYGMVPVAARTLAHFGAEVIKVESETVPAQERSQGPFKDHIPGLNRSGLFAHFNADKYGVTINVKHPEGLKLAKKLISKADVVMEAFTPGKMEEIGLGYQELVKVKPDIIMLSATMQGQTGPHSRSPGLGIHAVGLSGFTYLWGYPDRPPVGVPSTAYPDFFTCWYIAIAVLASLEYRRQTGKGQYIDISQYECSQNFLAPAILDYAVNGRVQTCRGNKHDYATPHNVYPCKGDDRWCAIAVFSDEEWEAFCRVTGKPTWVKDERFATFLGRKQNEEQLDKLIGAWTINFSAEEVTARLQASGVAAGIVEEGEDLIEKDPQLKHRNFWWYLNHPEMGNHCYMGFSFNLSKTPGKIRKPSPCLGEHNYYVCTEVIGMSDEEFAEILQSGALS